MKRTLLMLTLAVLLALGALPAAAVSPVTDPAPLHRTAGEAVPGSYVVVVEAGRDAAAVAHHAGATPTSVYSQAVPGFAADLSAAQLEAVRRHPDVAYVEENSVFSTAHHNLQFDPPSWGLDRIDQRFLPLDKLYAWHADATDVHAYVFDTGLDYPHPGFDGRAHFAYDVFGGNGWDCHGHGTHVGGTIGAVEHGVSKNVQLWSVRVLNCAGIGTLEGILEAIEEVINDHRKPAVANFSLGGGFSQALNDAIDKLAKSRVFVAVAAGNTGIDACLVSPASASLAYTASGTNAFDGATYNHGPCVDIYAPGVGIESLWPGGGTLVASGTSMAAPHVAGTAAQFKARFGDYPSQTLGEWLTRVATDGELSNVPPDTPNLLLYKPWEL